MKKLLNAVVYVVVAVLVLFGSIVLIPSSAFAVDLVVTWTAPGDDGDRGIATTYLVYYSTQQFDETNLDQLLIAGVIDTTYGCGPPDTAGTQEVCVVLQDLQSDTDYWVAIKTADEVPNWSPLSNVGHKKTPDVTGPRRIDDLLIDFQ
jgi:hypothetical protein